MATFYLQLLDAQLVLRMRTLEAQEQEERKRKLELEVLNMELESRKKALMDRALPLPASL
jgi:hypothetical protein